jgi:putative tryptophan/tyrosine transport system substrate-binding protein
VNRPPSLLNMLLSRHTRRREFITLIGSAAAAWPVAAHAQQPAMPVVGFLHPGSSEAFSTHLGFLRQGLKDNGYLEDKNVAIEYRWAEDRPGRLRELATDLVRQKVDVIAALGGTNSVLAAKASTTTIPIVFLTGGDPVKLRLVNSLNRPEANVTGITNIFEDLGAKDIGLLHELIPDAKSVGFLVNADNPNASQQIKDLQEAARSLRLEIQPFRAKNERELQEAFDNVAKRALGAMLVGADPYFGSNVNQIVRFAADHRIPTVYYRREFTNAGGLMSYGTSTSEAWRQVGVYIARILKGAKPGDLPVLQSTKFELVINLSTARALGLTIPPGLLSIADEVIE